MNKKVSIIGAGYVGASLAMMIVQGGIADVVLIDVDKEITRGKALDLAEACPLWGSSSSIAGTNDFSSTLDSDVLVITAGLARKPGMSRDDLLSANAKIVSDVISNVAKLSPRAIIIAVTNPMDVMAHICLKVSGFEPSRVVGMGGVLDSARLRAFTAMELGVSPQDVEALVCGGHGDLMVPMPRFTTVRGVPITELINRDRIDALVQRTRQGGAEIVSLLKTGSAYYAPAAATCQMVDSIIFDKKRMMPCSAFLNGEYGAQGVYTGVPVILGSGGVEKIIELKLNVQEKTDLAKSVSAVKELVEQLKL
jgi:malate dehydrogenase